MPCLASKNIFFVLFVCQRVSMTTDNPRCRLPMFSSPPCASRDSEWRTFGVFLTRLSIQSMFTSSCLRCLFVCRWTRSRFVTGASTALPRAVVLRYHTVKLSSCDRFVGKRRSRDFADKECFPFSLHTRTQYSLQYSFTGQWLNHHFDNIFRPHRAIVRYLYANSYTLVSFGPWPILGAC